MMSAGCDPCFRWSLGLPDQPAWTHILVVSLFRSGTVGNITSLNLSFFINKMSRQ